VSDLRGLDWYGEDLSGREHTGDAFWDGDLSEVTGTASTFTDCTFGGVRFNAARLTGSAFRSCTFTRCSFFAAELEECSFVGSRFTDCTLRPLTVRGGDWSFVSLVGQDLRGTTFDGVRLREVDLTRADLSTAAVTGADLSGAELTDSTWTGADLRGSDLSAFDVREVALAGVLIRAEQAVTLAQALGLRIG